jgi:hypothetical protein
MGTLGTPGEAAADERHSRRRLNCQVDGMRRRQVALVAERADEQDAGAQRDSPGRDHIAARGPNASPATAPVTAPSG